MTTLLFKARSRIVKPLETVQVREQILVGGMLRTQLSSLFIAFQGGQDDHCWNPLANATYSTVIVSTFLKLLINSHCGKKTTYKLHNTSFHPNVPKNQW